MQAYIDDIAPWTVALAAAFGAVSVAFVQHYQGATDTLYHDLYRDENLDWDSLTWCSPSHIGYLLLYILSLVIAAAPVCFYVLGYVMPTNNTLGLDIEGWRHPLIFEVIIPLVLTLTSGMLVPTMTKMLVSRLFTTEAKTRGRGGYGVLDDHVPSSSNVKQSSIDAIENMYQRIFGDRDGGPKANGDGGSGGDPDEFMAAEAEDQDVKPGAEGEKERAEEEGERGENDALVKIRANTTSIDPSMLQYQQQDERTKCREFLEALLVSRLVLAAR